MPVTQNALTTGSDTTFSTSYTTASISPAADNLILAAVVHTDTAPATATASLSGNGLTWVSIATVDYSTIANNSARLWLFRSMGASPSSGTVTIDFGADSQTGCLWSIAEFASVDTSGTNGSGAVVQSATNVADMVSGLTVTLAAFGSVDNATYGAFGHRTAAVTWTPGAGFSQIHQTDMLTPTTEIFTEWKNSNDTTVDATTDGSNDPMAGIAVEIKYAAAAASGSSLTVLGVG